MTEPKILHLTLKKKWFDMIAADNKPEEYRDIKEYWAKRFCGKEWYKYDLAVLEKAICVHYDAVHFARGGHFHPSIPQMTVECKGIEIRFGNREWGAEPGIEYFVIKLGKIISINNHQP